MTYRLLAPALEVVQLPPLRVWARNLPWRKGFIPARLLGSRCSRAPGQLTLLNILTVPARKVLTCLRSSPLKHNSKMVQATKVTSSPRDKDDHRQLVCHACM